LGYQFSELNLTGALINTAGNVQFVSGSQIPTFTPFTPPVTTPEPSTVALALSGLGTMGLVAVRRRRAAKAAA